MGKYTFDSSMTTKERLTAENWPPKGGNWHREAVGGNWDVIGKVQLDFLVKKGMEKESHLLDIGCGSLRAGVRFIEYLNAGCYFGIDHDRDILAAAVGIEIPKHGLESKRPTVVYADQFDLPFDPPSGGFDFMMAQSVFTHIDPVDIEMCLSKMAPLLGKHGLFFATFNLSRREDTIRCGVPYPVMTEYPIQWFKEAAGKAGLEATYIGGWGHPANRINNQLMIQFNR